MEVKVSYLLMLQKYINSKQKNSEKKKIMSLGNISKHFSLG